MIEHIVVCRLRPDHDPEDYAGVIEAVCMSLPEIDDATRDRYLALVNEGPPTETVGLTFLGDLKPFAAGGAAPEEARR